jgi:hypothetical protein
MLNNNVGEVSPSLQPPSNLTANKWAFSATPSCPNKLAKTTLLLIFLFAVCVNAEWKFDNDTDVQEKGDKRNEEREQARKALEGVRFGVKVGGGYGVEAIGNDIEGGVLDGGIMINIPLSRLKDANLVLATELNFGYRGISNLIHLDPEGYEDHHYEETYLNIPLMLQYVSFFYPTSDIQVHWVPSPKRYFYMHFKTIKEVGVFFDIPFVTTHEWNWYNGGFGKDKEKNYKDRNSFDIGGMVGYAAQLENIILGLRLAASYVDFGGSSLLLQGKMYLGYLF